MNYGIMTDVDKGELEKSLDRLVEHFPDVPVRLLEIGIHEGHTSRGIRDYLTAKGATIDYWCVDSGRDNGVEVPFPGVHMVWGDSLDVAHMVPDDFHWILIDGCHCQRHVIGDFWLYAPKLVPGGQVLVHDISPFVQRFFYYQGHGPADRPESYQYVRQTLERMNLLPTPPLPWKLLAEAYADKPVADMCGGFAVYEKGLL